MTLEPGKEADLGKLFASVDRVVADPLRFKLRLGIGEEAYASLRIKKKLQDVWDVGGVAATGATAAASSTVAGTFFASTASGGIWGALGLGAAAATPMGWVLAAALASGGAYYGVTRMMQNFSGARVETIPKFLNTPLDLLAASLVDLIGGLAARVSAIDGAIDPSEREEIARHFTIDWGIDADYLAAAMVVIYNKVDSLQVKELAKSLASFQIENPDCNPVSMQAELMAFLQNVVEADGTIDEREELALDAIAQILREETDFSFQRAGRQLVDWGTEISKTARDSASGLVDGLTRKWQQLDRKNK